MSVLTEWFEGRGVEDGAGVVIVPLPLWAILVIAVLVCLPGCATKEEPRDEVCFLHPLGRTQDGLHVVAARCMTPEQFAESQK